MNRLMAFTSQLDVQRLANSYLLTYICRKSISILQTSMIETW